ncbi:MULTISPECIES: efflux transporter outer membrane subunit [unclassified Brenneria]|uniref:efflux transporter outer membrane subunit n=1 Tax=unclassified Brenneria TaxID=2634434 RepID=UPI0029C26BE2|nr:MULTISPECIES: efflux transporter outer membrane subunit [unclassified Brenneria]MDX5630737.1 efflux transporter outer membrane subunit [Brenneria sp. L3-3Z]MDX5697849.1 efflux transporter outer membrane subunit [Brenneria sp. L4-2C]
MPLQICRRLTPLFAVLILAGCASDNHIAPQSSLLDTRQLHLHQEKVSSLSISPQWWRGLNDPQLDELMTTALQNSPSLRQAAARVREAQSVMEKADAANGPYLDLNGSMRRERVAKNTIPPFLSRYPDAPIYDNSNSLGLNLSYEFDWWGKYRNQANAAQAQVDSSRAEQAEAALTLTCSVASAYYQLQANLALQDVLRNQVDNHRRLADLRQAQYQAGVYGIEIPQQTRAQADGAKQQLIVLSSQSEQLRHQLSALAGRGPDAMNGLRAVTPPSADALAPKGELTLDLLGQRPDITAQRDLVESYSQRVSAAKKAFYPSLAISAFGGLTTTNSPNLLEAASKAWNIAPAISLPIFHAGALRAQLGAESALFDQSVESYNQTILNAIQQTADAITLSKSSAEQLQQASFAAKSLEEAYRVSEARYRVGIIGRDERLSSQLAFQQQQQAQLRAGSQLMQAKIRLIQALGGGYQAPAADKNHNRHMWRRS